MKHLPLKNLLRRPARAVALLLLVTLLSGALFGGTLVISSLKSGVSNIGARLGADIIVVPYSAKSKVNLSQLMLTGTTGYFYTKASYLEEIRAIEGVEQASPQLFLASLRADCCSVPIQVIGIDQETDFTVEPWIAQSTSRKLGDMEVAVGCEVSSDIREQIRIYGQNVTVVARLSRTDTDMDTAVYCSMETLRALLEAAQSLGHDLEIDGDPADVISAIYIKVADDTDVETVTNYINLHLRKLEAVSTRSMLSGISDSLDGVASTVTLLMAAVWVLAFILLVLTFALLANERKKEFAVLRVIGMSRSMLARTALAEALLVSLAGALLGIAVGAVIVIPFSTLIETSLGLPFLLPGVGTMLLYGLATLAAVLVIGPLASAWSVFRLSRVDTGTILREAN